MGTLQEASNLLPQLGVSNWKAYVLQDVLK